MNTTTDAGRLIEPVLENLAAVMENVQPQQFSGPTPCADFDVAALRNHIVGWATFFAAAFNDPEGSTERPDPKQIVAPDDPHEAAEVLRAASGRIAEAVNQDVADRSVKMVQSSMPGDSMLRLALWEYVAHGDDLARSTGQPWDPPLAAVESVLELGSTMLTDDYRGPGKDFDVVVPVPDNAPPLDRLLGFCGRDPNWKP
jgi:uncharacterized protein (TIGR03086 family)